MGGQEWTGSQSVGGGGVHRAGEPATLGAGTRSSRASPTCPLQCRTDGRRGVAWSRGTTSDLGGCYSEASWAGAPGRKGHSWGRGSLGRGRTRAAGSPAAHARVTLGRRTAGVTGSGPGHRGRRGRRLVLHGEALLTRDGEGGVARRVWPLSLQALWVGVGRWRVDFTEMGLGGALWEAARALRGGGGGC